LDTLSDLIYEDLKKKILAAIKHTVPKKKSLIKSNKIRNDTLYLDKDTTVISRQISYDKLTMMHVKLRIKKNTIKNNILNKLRIELNFIILGKLIVYIYIYKYICVYIYINKKILRSIYEDFFLFETKQFN
jgi:hypothetical protein